MQLYTINATPVRESNSGEKNESLVACYPSIVARILKASGIDGFTIYQVHGYWEGKAEVSFKIEIATAEESTILAVACKLRDKYEQDSVMITMPDNTVEFI